MADKILKIFVSILAAAFVITAGVTASAEDNASSTVGATVAPSGTDGAPSSATPVATATATASATTAATPSASASSSPSVSPSVTSAPAPVSDAVGGWALVDANGNVLTVAVCTWAVCGDPNSIFRQLTLGPGQNWVLQTQADAKTGNVAGWNNGTKYDEKTNTFELPGGGKLIGGSKLEDAVFPTPTPMPNLGATAGATVGAPNSSLNQTYESNSGVVYQTAAAYISGEAKILTSAKSVVVDLPKGLKQTVIAKVYFTPIGSRNSKLITTSAVKAGKDLTITNKKIIGQAGKLEVKFLTAEGKTSTIKKTLKR